MRNGDTVAGLARAMATHEFAEEQFRVLNGLVSGEQPRVGSLVKYVAE